MKALFVKVNGPLTMDMLVGGLIDMGVPAVYLKAKGQEAGVPTDFVEKATTKAQISAHYFCMPRREDRATKESAETVWASYWKDNPEKVEAVRPLWESLFMSESPVSVTVTDVQTLFYFYAGLEYLEIESFFTVPFSLGAGKTEEGKETARILSRAGSTVGLPLAPEGITPFVATLLETLSTDFLPIDSQFLSEKVSYGTFSSTVPDGDTTVALQLGYFQHQGDSVFRRQMKTFGAD